MAVRTVLPDLHLVDLDQSLPGFREFISCWIVTRGGRTLVVDPGPRSSLPVLKDALGQLGVQRVDAILLTHIHIDHAGGAGLLLHEHPTAQVVCHSKGIQHMVEPTRLWEGSRQVLGEVADAYGPIEPVPPDRIGYAERLTLALVEVEVLETPGHAPHHLSFVVGDLMFSGEAAGVHCQTAAGPYQRPATPPVFKYEIYRASLEKLVDHPVTHLCFGHYGHSDAPAQALETARRQLDHWIGVVERHLDEAPEEGAAAAFQELLETDPVFRRIEHLPEDIQARERYFFRNTFTGMAGSLQQA